MISDKFLEEIDKLSMHEKLDEVVYLMSEFVKRMDVCKKDIEDEKYKKSVKLASLYLIFDVIRKEVEKNNKLIQ
jgi:hypothetical protein